MPNFTYDHIFNSQFGNCRSGGINCSFFFTRKFSQVTRRVESLQERKGWILIANFTNSSEAY